MCHSTLVIALVVGSLCCSLCCGSPDTSKTVPLCALLFSQSTATGNGLMFQHSSTIPDLQAAAVNELAENVQHFHVPAIIV